MILIHKLSKRSILNTFVSNIDTVVHLATCMKDAKWHIKGKKVFGTLQEGPAFWLKTLIKY